MKPPKAYNSTYRDKKTLQLGNNFIGLLNVEGGQILLFRQLTFTV